MKCFRLISNHLGVKHNRLLGSSLNATRFNIPVPVEDQIMHFGFSLSRIFYKYSSKNTYRNKLFIPKNICLQINKLNEKIERPDLKVGIIDFVNIGEGYKYILHLGNSNEKIYIYLRSFILMEIILKLLINILPSPETIKHFDEYIDHVKRKIYLFVLLNEEDDVTLQRVKIYT